MPVIAGWLTGEQVPEEVIQQTLLALGEVLGQHGGQPARTVQPGMGLLTHFDPAQAIQRNDEPPVLDWVPERRTLVYRRPLSGAHPLYYIEDWPAQGNLLFASEIKALLAIGAPRRLHLAALDALWRYGFIPAPWTAFEAISIVPAGSILRWQHAKTVVNTSTDIHLAEPLSPATDTHEQVRSLLTEKTAHLLPAEDNPASLIALSGGGPASSLVTLLASQQSDRPFTISSLGYTKTVAAKAWSGVKHLADRCQQPFLAITGVDQPSFWTATLAALEAPSVSTRPLALHQLFHTAVTATQARAALTGLGAQVLCPTDSFQDLSTSRQEESLLPWYAQTLSSHANSETFPFWSAETAQTLHTAESWESSLYARKLARHAAQLGGTSQSRYYLDLHLRLPDLLVAPAYQLAIQEQLALRSPFLHATVLDTLTRLPDQAKNNLLSHLATQTLGEMSNRKLPLSLPTASLFQNTETDLWQQTLSSEALQTTSLFDPAAIARLVQQKPSAQTIRALLFVFTTQLFCQMFGVEI
jgi:asparagine synthetase B (glutamine-hydrolysing)